ncbi:hypothetical protein ACGFZP_12825 [Kitasatospora sp. NPDC048239]|uniref:zinc finger domain-containing protein n=1 Tax=Kitasatospora sp. NPDC048239 TaxID=3364046 RepID=UPI0037118F5C
MTPAQAAALLGHIAAYDRRTVGETDARAWAAALRDVPLDQDALQAVAEFYGRPGDDRQRWIQPHNVVTLRAAIRHQRIPHGVLAYPADGRDETGTEYARNRRAQLAAIADGNARPELVAITDGGPHPDIEAAITGVGAIPDDARRLLESALPMRAARERARRDGQVDLLGVPCRWCQAPAGEQCRRHTRAPRDGAARWSRRNSPHPSRVDDAKAHHAQRRTA